ncbi:MAG: hypothetical protein O3B95_09980 [Chloroflexi bacterium]|nr:hypothetical protein [Chloroflexota bacterium]
MFTANSAIAAGSLDTPAPLVSAEGNLQPRTKTDNLGRVVPVTHDDLLVEVAAIVPGFGGFYRDPGDKNVTVILLDDPSKLSRARDAMVAVFGESILRSGSVRADHADYDLRALKQWYDDVVSGLRQEFDVVNERSIDESNNQIKIGISDLAQTESIIQYFLEHGVPRSAVNVIYAGPLVFDADLGDKQRPVKGGLEIESTTATIGCTLGFLTKRDGTPGFVTNSHCTNTEDGDDSSPNNKFSQDDGSTDLIGTEQEDNALYTGGSCAGGDSCRDSDGAFISLNAGMTYGLGYIAKTTGLGSTTIASSPNEWRITSEGVPGANDDVERVGYINGWDTGTVSDTCVSVGEASRTILCATKVSNFGGGSGDSGAPVFEITTGSDVFF